jgi:hypothetical protein
MTRIGKISIQHVGAGATPACWGAKNLAVKRTATRGRKARAYVLDQCGVSRAIVEPAIEAHRPAVTSAGV